jgi:hypothetical protein
MIFPLNHHESIRNPCATMFLRSQDGSIVTWGGRRSGGDASAVAKQLQVASVRRRKDAQFPMATDGDPRWDTRPNLVELSYVLSWYSDYIDM